MESPIETVRKLEEFGENFTELGDSTKKTVAKTTLHKPSKKTEFSLVQSCCGRVDSRKNISNPMTWSLHLSMLLSWNLQLSNVVVEGLTAPENISHPIRWNLYSSTVAVEDLTPAKCISHPMGWSLHLSSVVAGEPRYEGYLRNHKCDCAFVSCCSAAVVSCCSTA